MVVLEAKLYDYDKKEYGTYYFESTSELTDYLSDNNVRLIYKREI